MSWKLACILRIHNSTLRFSKYEFNNKLLGGVTLFKVTPGIFIYIFDQNHANTMPFSAMHKSRHSQNTTLKNWLVDTNL